MIEVREENPNLGDELHQCATTQEAMGVLKEAVTSRGKFIMVDGQLKSYDVIDADMLNTAQNITLIGKLKGG